MRTFSKISFICTLGFLPLTLMVQADGRAKSAPLGGQSSSVQMFGGNAQHTSIYQPAAQIIDTIQWSTSIDVDPGNFGHYGAPVITAANTLLVSMLTSGLGVQVNAYDAVTGTQKYSLTSDYRFPNHDWIPVYNPCITTGSFGTRVYYAGRGGTIYYIDNPDAATPGTPVHQVFYTTLANYLANATAFNNSIFINTPITADSQGNIFFGFRVQGTAPAPLSTTQSGFARLDPNGNGIYVLASAAAQDNTINRDSHNSAPALSNDESTLYVVAKNNSSGEGYLIGLNSTTLATRYRVFLTDPRNSNGADISDDSTASPTVGPDGDVYIGVLSNPGNGSRGFLLHFSEDLATEKTPGGFGWDYTPAIVPASMVPSYHGTSSYLLFSKYNNYAGFGDGDGANRIALLDPNATQLDSHPTAPGLVEMREVFSAFGPTPDENALSSEFPYAVREWCINTAAVNPATNSIFTPSEDGHVYRWNLATNSFAQAVELNEGIGQPYVPTVIGPSGLVYTLNGGTLFALGPLNGVSVAVTSTVPDLRSVVFGQSLTFTATVTNTGPSGVVPTGTVTFQDFTYQNLTPVTTTLASNVSLDANGQATVTTSALTAGTGFLGNHFVTAVYSGDAVFTHGNGTMMQKVHAQASTTMLTSSPNPSTGGQLVTFTATVTPSSPEPTGMVTFQEGDAILAQVPLNTNGTASFTTSGMSGGDHTVTATYYSDTTFATSSGNRTQTVVGGSTPTPTPVLTATPTPAPTPTPGSPTPTPVVTATPTPGATPTPAPFGHAINLSTRMLVQTNDNVGIGGFIITGTAPKHVVVRAIGPSLAASGVPDPLADPVLELHGPDGFTTITNDNWRDTQESVIIADGIAPTNDLESAIDATLDPGAYTAVVRGKNNTTGVALVEIYDLNPQAASALGDISTRAVVSTGGDIVIAGFILGGDSNSDLIMIRGIGPSLTALGVPNALADPNLELRDSNGSVIIANNNWQDDPAQAEQLEAAGLSLSDASESGMAQTLMPGVYTALLSGVNNGVGVGLVEVYDTGPQ